MSGVLAGRCCGYLSSSSMSMTTTSSSSSPLMTAAPTDPGPLRARALGTAAADQPSIISALRASPRWHNEREQKGKHDTASYGG